jgi:hypothetical protein
MLFTAQFRIKSKLLDIFKQHLFVLAFIILVLSPYVGYSQQSKPSVKEVIYEFSKNYEMQFINDSLYPKVAYKKDGIYIVFSNYRSYKEILNVLFYDYKTNSYTHEFLSQIQPKFTNRSTDEILSTYNSFLGLGVFEYSYHRNIYYGYEGAEKDVIQEFGSKELNQLSESELEALARAYSEYSRRLNVLNQTRSLVMIPNEENFSLTKNSKQRQDSAVKYVLLASKVYEVLNAKNPKYKTILGNPASKVFNEIMSGYYFAWLDDDTARQKMYLNLVKNDQEVLKLGNIIFRDIAPNSILFVFGDNDTYPLLYCQGKYNMRKDITVINTSLLSSMFYAKYINRALDMDRLEYTPYLSVKNEGNEEPIALDMFLKNYNVNTENNPDQFAYPLNHKVYKWLDSFPSFPDSLIVKKKLQIHISSASDASDMKILRIVEKYAQTRPIYFVSKPSMFYDNFSLSSGFSYRLTPELDSIRALNYYRESIASKIKDILNFTDTTQKFVWDDGMIMANLYPLFDYFEYLGKKDFSAGKRLFNQVYKRYKDEISGSYKLSYGSHANFFGEKKLAETLISEYWIWVNSNPNKEPKEILTNKIDEARSSINNYFGDSKIKLPFPKK